MNRTYAAQPYETKTVSSGQGELVARQHDAKDGSERLFNAMARVIERIARRTGRSFDEAAIMAQNSVGLS